MLKLELNDIIYSTLPSKLTIDELVSHNLNCNYSNNYINGEEWMKKQSFYTMLRNSVIPSGIMRGCSMQRQLQKLSQSTISQPTGYYVIDGIQLPLYMHGGNHLFQGKNDDFYKLRDADSLPLSSMVLEYQHFYDGSLFPASHSNPTPELNRAIGNIRLLKSALDYMESEGSKLNSTPIRTMPIYLHRKAGKNPAYISMDGDFMPASIGIHLLQQDSTKTFTFPFEGKAAACYVLERKGNMIIYIHERNTMHDGNDTAIAKIGSN